MQCPIGGREGGGGRKKGEREREDIIMLAFSSHLHIDEILAH
jgi:hypothetical protein